MKKSFLLFIFLVFCFDSFAIPVGPISYQGRLLDSQGVPVNGRNNFVVRFYDAATSGVLKYQENHNAVSVDNGVYSFKIGNGPKTGGDSEWDVDLWQLNQDNLFLEIEVNGEIFATRYKLTSAPHAYTATLALSADSLGAKTAAEYDNILEGVCVASKGKWLSIVEQCAGGAIDLTGVFWPDVDPSGDYSHTEFDGANFTDSEFSEIDFSSSTFKNVNITGSNFSDTDFTHALWDGVFSTQPITLDYDLSGAQLINMDLSNFSFPSDDYIKNISTSDLTACPASLPPNWACRVQKTSPSTVYHLVGWGAQTGFGNFGVNYSTDAATTVIKEGKAYIDIDNFDNADVSWGNFSDVFIDHSFNNAEISEADFSGSEIEGVDFSQVASGNGMNYNNAALRYVNFSKVDGTADITTSTFDDAELFEVSFRNIQLEDVSYIGTVIANSDFTNVDDNGAGVYFTNAKIYHSSFRNPQHHAALYQFTGALLKGEGPNGPRMFTNIDMASMDFTGATLIDIAFDNDVDMGGGTFVNTVWVNPTFNSVIAGGADFTGALFYELEPGALNGIINWVGATCPDGNPASSGANPSSCTDQLIN